jgi:hypothetical protein
MVLLQMDQRLEPGPENPHGVINPKNELYRFSRKYPRLGNR